MYTHYFTQNRAFNESEWEAIRATLVHLVPLLPEQVEAYGEASGEMRRLRDSLTFHGGVGEGDQPGFLIPGVLEQIIQPFTEGEEAIIFNGNPYTAEDHEDFVLMKRPCTPDDGFCKTARKPYDVMVCATLIIAAHIAPEALDISSDGTSREWRLPLLLVRQHCFRDAVMPYSIQAQPGDRQFYSAPIERVSIAGIPDSAEAPDLYF